jgi:hypothetical protein
MTSKDGFWGTQGSPGAAEKPLKQLSPALYHPRSQVPLLSFLPSTILLVSFSFYNPIFGRLLSCSLVHSPFLSHFLLSSTDNCYLENIIFPTEFIRLVKLFPLKCLY